MNCCRSIYILFACLLLITTGCKKKKVENSVYESYFERAKTAETNKMPDILDTVSVLFEKESPGLMDRGTYLKLKAVYYRDIGDFTSSLKVLDSLKTLLTGHEAEPFYKELYPAMLFLMEEDYSELEAYDQAMSILLTATKFIEKSSSDKCLKANFHAKIGEIFMLQRRSKMAIIHFLSCKEAAQFCVDDLFDRFYYSYSSLYKISICYLTLKMYDSAQYYCDTTMNYVLANRSAFPEKERYFVLCKALVNANIAAIKTHTRQYDEAEQLILSTIKETEGEYPSYAYFCKLDLLNIYIKADKLLQAKQLINFFDTSINSPKSFPVSWHTFEFALNESQ